MYGLCCIGGVCCDVGSVGIARSIKECDSERTATDSELMAKQLISQLYDNNDNEVNRDSLTLTWTASAVKPEMVVFNRL